MNKITNCQLSAEEHDSLDLWAANARDQYAALSAPMLPGHERLPEYGLLRHANLSPEFLGKMWASEHLEIEWPLPAPSWAVEAVTSVMTYPEVRVSFSGRGHSAGDYSAWIAVDLVYFVDDHTNPDGSVDHRGDLDVEPVTIRHSASDDELSPQAAIGLASALISAAAELRDSEAR